MYVSDLLATGCFESLIIFYSLSFEVVKRKIKCRKEYFLEIKSKRFLVQV
jgi:hypothetical protein